MSEPITEEEVAELERLERIATSPPWVWEAGQLVHHESGHVYDIFPPVPGCSFDADGKYVAAVRNLAPRLIADWRRLRERVEELEKAEEGRRKLLGALKGYQDECNNESKESA